jgi:hypothetical protein
MAHFSVLPGVRKTALLAASVLKLFSWHFFGYLPISTMSSCRMITLLYNFQSNFMATVMPGSMSK